MLPSRLRDLNRLLPLRSAVNRQHVAVVELLLKAGAQKGRSAHSGVSPLEVAVTRGNRQIIAMLDDDVV